MIGWLAGETMNKKPNQVLWVGYLSIWDNLVSFLYNF